LWRKRDATALEQFGQLVRSRLFADTALTDGEATTGTTDTPGILNIVSGAAEQSEVLWNSESLPFGTYFYTIEVDGEILKGKLTKV